MSSKCKKHGAHRALGIHLTGHTCHSYCACGNLSLSSLSSASQPLFVLLLLYRDQLCLRNATLAMPSLLALHNPNSRVGKTPTRIAAEELITQYQQVTQYQHWDRWKRKSEMDEAITPRSHRSHGHGLIVTALRGRLRDP
ncbi:hypothetical protein J6590_045221 [Homalodisca vitripennis]|nr:hypothetical protein J6590_045221 [Homalodisca vitripennis]